MIVDLDRFLARERPQWQKLEEALGRLERDPFAQTRLAELRRLHYLYERAAAGLARLRTFAHEPHLESYLEALVARAYGEIHETRRQRLPFRPLRFVAEIFPRTFRRHAAAFGLAVIVTLLGALFGAGALLLDPAAKGVLMPFAHLLGDPSERVAAEEERSDGESGAATSFSAVLMTHNTRVAILCLALGIAWGVGTLVVLFYNGVILGAVVADYLAAGEGVFLAGWLLPHGAIEIPAILIAGQAGLVLAGTFLRRRGREPLTDRFRRRGPDLVVLIAGTAGLLVWAGLIEAFLSQHHEPTLPYAVKIAFGLGELALLGLYLALSGRRRGEQP